MDKQLCTCWGEIQDWQLELLVHPKDRDNILQKSGVIYRFKCGRVDCKDEYIGESGRTFTERFRENMRAQSPIHDYFNITGHEVSLDNFSIVGMEDLNMARSIREAMLIRVNGPSLNRNIGKYQLPHIWDEVLVNKAFSKSSTFAMWEPFDGVNNKRSSVIVSQYFLPCM